MAIDYFERKQLHAAPWKNGGGVTCEVACHPPQASFQNFDWRISIAQISSDGDFSVFSGVDRVITLLEGAGVQLGSPDGLIDHRLNSPWSPFAFPGDSAVHARLLGQDCHDLNVMTRRSVCRAGVFAVKTDAMTRPAPAGLLFALQDTWQVDIDDAYEPAVKRFCLAPDTGLWWTDDSLAWSCRPTRSDVAADAGLLVVLIHPTPNP
jgi:hypothetical protein